MRGGAMALAVALALCAASGRVSAQTTAAVSRTEATARAAESSATSRFFGGDDDTEAETSTINRNRNNYFSNYFNRGDNFQQESGRCSECFLFGAADIFAAPLYDNCDVFLLESLFDRAFNFEVAGQATILNQTVRINNNGNAVVPVPITTTSLELSNQAFNLVFEQVNRNDFRGSPAAPAFLARFSGISSPPNTPPFNGFGATGFEVTFLCSLNPSIQKNFADANCVGDLSILQALGVIPELTFLTPDPPPEFFNSFGCDDGDIVCICSFTGCNPYDPGLFTVGFPAPLTFYTLTFKRDRHCRSQNVLFNGSNVVRQRSAEIPGPMQRMSLNSTLDGTTNFDITQQLVLVGTRVFRFGSGFQQYDDDTTN